MTTQTATQDVFDRVLARPTLRDGREDLQHVHLWWRAPHQGERLVQVYVNDQLIDVSDDPAQRDMLLLLDRTQAQRIELLAVAIDDRDARWRPHVDALRCWSPPVRSGAAVTVVRDEAVAVDVHAVVLLDDAVADGGALWPADEHRGGFGALFGIGAFGHDAATGPGAGLGELGMGPLGADGSAWRWRRDRLPPGAHTLAVRLQTRDGQPLADDSMLYDLDVDALPREATDLAIAQPFTLTWQ